MEKMYTLKEVADMLGLEVKSLRRWIKDGKLEVVRLPNGHYRMTETQFNEMIDKGKRLDD